MTADKFRALAWLTKLREIERVPNQGSGKEHMPKSSVLMTKFISAHQSNQSQADAVSQDPSQQNYEVPSQVGFDGQRLSQLD